MPVCSLYDKRVLQPGYHPVLQSCYYHEWTTRDMQQHMHDRMEIMCVIKGECDVRTGEEQVRLLAGDFILGLSGEKPKLYGEGCSEKTVYYLDKGVIASLVVPNEFFMGYQCVKELAEKINYHQDNGVTEDTVDFLSATRENLYDRDTENILFPNIS